MNYLIYDLVLLAVLAAFALWGARRGLILSLFSLAAVLAALVGASLAANLLSPAAAGLLQPVLQPAVEDAVQAALPEGAAQLSAEDVFDALDGAALPMGLDRLAAELREDAPGLFQSESLLESLSAALAEKLAASAAYAGVFLLAFAVILILWRLLARALDLVARLPGLHTLNKAGGFLFGAGRGALLLFVCAWLVRPHGLFPEEAVEQTRLLRFFLTANPMDILASF